MGLVSTDLRILQMANRLNARRVLTIGRLRLYLHPSEIRRDFQNSPELRNYKWGDFCEPYLKPLLGAESIDSLDISDYQNATILKDLNNPIEDQDEQFDLIIDGGTLEHIFNFPVAITNLMRMTRTGGSLFLSNPANNLCGHGFYQFSPELMYRVLSKETGFSISEMALAEYDFQSVEIRPTRRVVRVRNDPMNVGRRSIVAMGKPLMLKTLACKTKHMTKLPTNLQQSDYVAAWSGTKTESIGLAKRIYRMLVPLRLRWVLSQYKERHNLSNREFFEPWP